MLPRPMRPRHRPRRARDHQRKEALDHPEGQQADARTTIDRPLKRDVQKPSSWRQGVGGRKPLTRLWREAARRRPATDLLQRAASQACELKTVAAEPARPNRLEACCRTRRPSRGENRGSRARKPTASHCRNRRTKAASGPKPQKPRDPPDQADGREYIGQNRRPGRQNRGREAAARPTVSLIMNRRPRPRRRPRPQSPQ